MTFAKIETKRKHLYVAEQILKAINDGVYKPGDKLPPERELAEQMQVSRNSIREALSALQVLNIVESKVGDGTYIKKPLEISTLKAQILPILEESDSPFKIFEARGVLEMGVVELAMENADAADIERIHTALKHMEEQADAQNYTDYLKANLDFHLAIAKATANPIVERMMSLLWETTSQRLLNEMLIDYWQKNILSSVEIHKQIFAAIKNHDKEKMRSLIRRHYHEPKEYFSGNLKEGGDDKGELE